MNSLEALEEERKELLRDLRITRGYIDEAEDYVLLL